MNAVARIVAAGIALTIFVLNQLDPIDNLSVRLVVNVAVGLAFGYCVTSLVMGKVLERRRERQRAQLATDFPLLYGLTPPSIPVPMLSSGGAKLLRHATKQKAGGPMFCPHCGGRAVLFEGSYGFNPDGTKRKTQTMACVDWSQATAPDDVYGGEVVGCGNLVQDPYAPTVVHDHAEEEVKLDCARCLIQMEKMGVLTREETQAKLDALPPELEVKLAAETAAAEAQLAALAAELDLTYPPIPGSVSFKP